MSRSSVSFFVHDLAANPIGRAAPLAQALQATHDVEILGLLLSGSEVYAPYRDLFVYRTLRCSFALPAVLQALPRLGAMARGDVIYACKPLLASLGPALYASGLGRRKPMLLDVDDDEWIPWGKTWSDFLQRDVVGGWRHAIAWKYTRLLHPFTRFAAGITVSSSLLQRRYGGTVIRHGPDEHVFDPSRPELGKRSALRRKLGLPLDRPLALFAGVPQPHKGWTTLLSAMRRPECSGWDLVLVGRSDHSDFQRAVAELGARCHCLGEQTREQMVETLAAVDAVPIPQSRVAFAESQLPAKAMDAMAMAKAVLCSRVGDLPEILGNGERGWLFEPEDSLGLAAALSHVAEAPEEAARRGKAARQWFLREASGTAIRARIEPLLGR